MAEDDSERCLDLIQKLYTDKLINDEQRDSLKDMLFDEDAILLSFFQRFTEPDEVEDLKSEVIKYAAKSLQLESNKAETTETNNELDDMSSPMDSNIGVKKRMQALKAATKAKEDKEVKLGIGECEMGASPQMSKGAIWSRNMGGGGKTSPIVQAVHFKLGKRK